MSQVTAPYTCCAQLCWKEFAGEHVDDREGYGDKELKIGRGHNFHFAVRRIPHVKDCTFPTIAAATTKWGRWSGISAMQRSRVPESAREVAQGSLGRGKLLGHWIHIWITCVHARFFNQQQVGPFCKKRVIQGRIWARNITQQPCISLFLILLTVPDPLGVGFLAVSDA